MESLKYEVFSAAVAAFVGTSAALIDDDLYRKLPIGGA